MCRAGPHIPSVRRTPSCASIFLSLHGVDVSIDRLLPRPSFGILFDYAYDYDQKGIIFWIATNRGRGLFPFSCPGKEVSALLTHSPNVGPESWTNPHSAGRLRVTASSIEKGDPVKLVSKKPSELWSGACATAVVATSDPSPLHS